MSKPKVIVGQTVYVPCGTRDVNVCKLIPMIVTKIGSETYTASMPRGDSTYEIVFRIGCKMERRIRGRDRKAYFSKREFLDEWEHLWRFMQLQDFF